MSESINHVGGRDRETIFTDRDGDTARVEKARDVDRDLDKYVYVCASTAGAYVPAKEFIEAIEKAAGINKPVVGETVVNVHAVDVDSASLGQAAAWALRPTRPIADPEPKPLWEEVEYRPARAVKVTPELVRSLAEGGPEELSELEPRFFAKTGKPKGVEVLDPITLRVALVEVGQVVVLRHGQAPQPMDLEHFEKTYRKVSA